MSDPTPAADGPREPDHVTPVPSSGSLAGDTAGIRVCPTCGREYDGETRFCPRDGSVLHPKVRSDDLVGRIIADRYHILKKLGHGGMGEVYLAEHVKMGRRCAIKVMHPALRDDPDAVSRFSREAANVSRINHPHVADVYDFGETRDGLLYLAMEYVEGEPLSTLLARESPFPIARAVEIGLQIAEALAAAHAMGLVHRDLKPDNIIVTRTRDGRDFAKVVDFGIAKAAQSDAQNLTRTGFVVGTLHYMSPEQLIGETIDGRSDLYSLGCILYELLVGERAFDAPSGEVVITRRLTEPPPRPRARNPEVPQPLDDLVARLLARSPADRFQTAEELRDTLITLRPTSLPYRPLLTPSQPAEAINLPASPPVPTPTTPLAREEAATGPEAPPAAPALEAPADVAASEEEELSEPIPPLAATAGPGAEAEAARPVATASSTSGAGRHRSPLVAAALLGAVLVGGAVLYALSGSESPDPPVAVIEEPREPLPSVETSPVVDAPEAVDASPPEQAGLPEASPAASEPTSTPPPSAAPEPVRQAELRIGGDLPPGARILVNDRAIRGRTALLPPGTHTVQVTASGFTAVDSVFTLQAGEQRTWSPQLRRTETAAAPAAPVDPPPLAGRPVEPRPATPERVTPPEAEMPRPSPPAPPTVDREAVVAQIRGAINRYAQALESRDINQVRSVYPGLPRAEQELWEALFAERSVRGLQAEVTRIQAPQIQGTTAQVGFTLVLSYRDSGGPKRTELNYRATLGQEGDGTWRLRSIRN